MIESGDSELDRALRTIFPLAGPNKGRTTLEGYDNYGHYGGMSVDTPYGLTEGGLTGRRAIGRAGLNRCGALFSGLDKKACPPWMTDECLEVFGRLLEQTLRNVHLHASPLPHIAPPVQHTLIDIFPASAAGVAIAGGGYGSGTYTTIATYTVPDDSRAVIVALGQGTQTPSAWQDISWRVRVDAKSMTNYSDIRMQLWPMVLSGPNVWIMLRGGQTVDIQASALAATGYQVWARIFGWYFPTRSESGDNAQSFIVD